MECFKHLSTPLPPTWRGPLMSPTMKKASDLGEDCTHVCMYNLINPLTSCWSHYVFSHHTLEHLECLLAFSATPWLCLWNCSRGDLALFYWRTGSLLCGMPSFQGVTESDKQGSELIGSKKGLSKMFLWSQVTEYATIHYLNIAWNPEARASRDGSWALLSPLARHCPSFSSPLLNILSWLFLRLCLHSLKVVVTVHSSHVAMQHLAEHNSGNVFASFATNKLPQTAA